MVVCWKVVVWEAATRVSVATVLTATVGPVTVVVVPLGPPAKEWLERPSCAPEGEVGIPFELCVLLVHIAKAKQNNKKSKPDSHLVTTDALTEPSYL